MGYLSLALISMASLGVYYFFVKLISAHVSSYVIVLIGTFVSCLVIFTYLSLTRRRVLPARRIYILYSLLISIPLVAGLMALYTAIVRGPVSVVAPIFGLNAMVTALLGIIFLREKLSLKKVLGLALAVGAIVLLSL